MKINSIPLVLSLSSLVFFTACGENTTTEKIVEVATGGTEIVESVKDLPKCTKDNAGEQVWVKDESATRICVDGKWFATKESAKDTVFVAGDTVYLNGGDFSCTTKELNDKSGIKIICNGDSIGVVLNGAAGKDGEKGDAGEKGDTGEQGIQGEKGDNGVGCTIAAKTDSLVTIKCGDKSMTLNLRAGDVTVDTTSADTVVLDSEKIAISLDSLSGYSQKGPFLKGSTVYLYELSDGRTLKQTNGNFTSTINSNDGRYKFSSRNLVSQYALIEVEGQYRNEVTGKNTTTDIKLQAYTNMLMRKSANVNLLTHLEKDRVFYLVTKEKKTVRAAKKQAQTEILNAFHIDAGSINAESEDLDVFGKTDADAALLAISILLQRDSSETELSVLLTDMANDLAEDGTWDDAAKRAEIADWVATADTAGKLAEFRSHVKDWGLGDGNVPHFEKYVRMFYGAELGLGVCGDKDNPVGTVKNVSNPKSQKYYVEKYTDVTGVGGKIRFTCVDADSAKWRIATDIEKDRYNWNPVNAKDGSLLNGQISGRKMLWDTDTLRYANDLEISEGKGCASYNSGELYILKNQYSYYKCVNSVWELALDTLNQGTLEYEGQTYKTIGIKTQMWMAENLNYEVEGQSYCYNNEPDSCAKYGRLYTWVGAVGKTEEECGNYQDCGLTGTVRGICPEGWHLPDTTEWRILYSAMGDSPYAMQAKGFADWPNATDAYGFSALLEGTWFSIYSSAVFWSATESGSVRAYYWHLTTDKAYLTNNGKRNNFAVRCVMDEP